MPRRLLRFSPRLPLVVSLLALGLAFAVQPSLAQDTGEAPESAPETQRMETQRMQEREPPKAPETTPELRNGRRFDPGATRTSRAEGAPAQLDALAFYRGQWDVHRTVFDAEGEPTHTASCLAEVTYLNRGHGLFEQLHCVDFDGEGHSLDTVALLAFSLTHDRWVWGEASSFTESIQVADGRDATPLVLHEARRRGGTPRQVFLRHSFRKVTDSGFELATEESEYEPGDWKPVVTKSYTRREPREDFFAPAGELGSPAPDLPPEARQFDFLLGRRTSTHELTPPNGQTLRWRSHSTAVHVLDGHAVMEFDWFDADPNLPDAATTILRIYNRAQRRWESLFLPNRGNNLLYFGGRKEGDRIVLYPFETDTGSGNISRFIFHDIDKDTYKWFAEGSSDRGKTFQKRWIIEVARESP